MTKARMDWRNMTLELEGHAGSGSYGQDMVCCAISILSQALVNALADLSVQYNMSGVEWRGSPEDGTLKVQAKVCWANLTLIRAQFEVCVTGLRMLAEKYPEYIRLEEV